MTCTECAAPDNPILKVSGKVISYSNDENVLTNVQAFQPKPPFEALLYPNPAFKRLTIRKFFSKF